MTNHPVYRTQLAQTVEDRIAVQRLRYRVFVSELGGTGEGVDHDTQLERDHFDAFAAHLMLLDETRADGDQVVGTYRLMTSEHAQAAGRFYCADEYDLRPLYENGGQLLELGRSCLHADYRGGVAMQYLWAALASYVSDHAIDTLFGVGSFHGTDAASLARSLSLLHHRHLAPVHLRVRAHGPTALAMDVVPEAELDRRAAVRDIPALIKAYLRLGGTVGEGAFVDHAFNTTDICMILEKEAISALQEAIYTKDRGRG